MPHLRATIFRIINGDQQFLNAPWGRSQWPDVSPIENGLGSFASPTSLAGLSRLFRGIRSGAPLARSGEGRGLARARLDEPTFRFRGAPWNGCRKVMSSVLQRNRQFDDDRVVGNGTFLGEDHPVHQCAANGASRPVLFNASKPKKRRPLTMS
jgi:hypothetical protein